MGKMSTESPKFAATPADSEKESDAEVKAKKQEAGRRMRSPRPAPRSTLRDRCPRHGSVWRATLLGD